MESFKDEVYEQMDDISKLIEPFEYSVNNDLSKFPDEFEVTQDMINSTLAGANRESWIYRSLGDLVRNKIWEIGGLDALRTECYGSAFVENMFEFQVRSDDEEPSLTYNAITGEIAGGTIFIVKRQIAIEDNQIENKMATYAFEAIRGGFTFASEVNKKNLNAIAELFGATEARKERSWRKKVNHLANHYKNLVENRKLVVKDFELFKRFFAWNIAYIKNGSLPAMQNITTLKIMSRDGKAIYSMKEQTI